MVPAAHSNVNLGANRSNNAELACRCIDEIELKSLHHAWAFVPNVDCEKAPQNSVEVLTDVELINWVGITSVESASFIPHLTW